MNARTQLSAWSHGVLEAAALLAVVSVPVFVNFYAFRVFEQSKAALLVSLALVAALAGLVALLERGGPRGLGASLRHPLVVAAIVLWAATLLATITSIARPVSLVGSLERAQGLLSLTAALVLFAAVAAVARESERRERIVSALVAGTVPVAVYALAQAAGVEMVAGTVESAARVFGTLSNPIFLGAYLMLVLPLTLVRAGAAFGAGAIFRGGAVSAIALLQVAALLLTASRGPLLGLIAGGGLMLFAWAATRGRRPALVVAGLGLVVVLFLGALAVPSGPLTALRDAPVVGRLAQVSETAVGSQAARLRIWTSANRLVGSEPARLVTGYGPETLVYAILPVAEPNMGGRAQADRLVDRAHNVLLDAVLMTGVVGAVGLLLVFGGWLYTAIVGLGLAGPAADRRLLAALTALGTLLGLAAALVPAVSVAAAALALLGMVGGAAAYVLLAALRGRFPPVPADPLLLGLLGAGAAAIVEGAFGIRTVTTEVVFWTMAGLLVAASVAPRAPRAAAEAPRAAPGELVIAWSSGGAAFGLVMGGALGLLLYGFVVQGQPPMPNAMGVLGLLLLAGWVGTMVTAADAGESAAAAGIVSAFTLVAYAVVRWLTLTITGDVVALFSVTLLWLVAIALLAGTWLRTRAGKLPVASGPAAIVYPIAAIAAVAGIAVLAVRPVQADMLFQSAVANFNAGLETDDPNRIQLANALFDRAVAANPREAGYHSRWSELYTIVGSSAPDVMTAAGWFSRAQQEAARAEELEPLMPYHVYNRGHLQLVFAQMQPEGEREATAANAEAALAEAFEQAPSDPQVATELALARLLQGKAEGAVPLLEYVRDQLDPDNPAIWQLLATAYAAAGRMADAEAALSEAAAGGSVTPQTFVALGDLARRNEDLSAAIQWYERALETGPVSWAVIYNLGLMYRDIGDRDKALEVLSAAAQQAPSEDERLRAQDALESLLLGGEIVQP